MPRFVVKTTIQRGSALLEVGQVIELSLAEARTMPWAVELMREEAPAPPGGKEGKG